MERVRDEIKNATPSPANFLLGPNGERAVFNLADVTSIEWNQHTRVSVLASPPHPLTLQSFATLRMRWERSRMASTSLPTTGLPGRVHPRGGNAERDPAVQGFNNVYFTLFLPSGPRPETGWPIALIAGGTTNNEHGTSGNFASKLAANGIADNRNQQRGTGFGTAWHAHLEPDEWFIPDDPRCRQGD